MSRRLGCDLALHCQDIVQLAIETAGPCHFAVGADIEQTNNDANAVARALKSAVEQKVHAELP